MKFKVVFVILLIISIFINGFLVYKRLESQNIAQKQSFEQAEFLTIRNAAMVYGYLANPNWKDLLFRRQLLDSLNEWVTGNAVLMLPTQAIPTGMNGKLNSMNIVLLNRYLPVMGELIQGHVTQIQITKMSELKTLLESSGLSNRPQKTSTNWNDLEVKVNKFLELTSNSNE